MKVRIWKVEADNVTANDLAEFKKLLDEAWRCPSADGNLDIVWDKDIYLQSIRIDETSPVLGPSNVQYGNFDGTMITNVSPTKCTTSTTSGSSTWSVWGVDLAKSPLTGEDNGPKIRFYGKD